MKVFDYGRDVHYFCLRECDKSRVSMIDGDMYAMCCANLWKGHMCIMLRRCPLGKWETGFNYHILPMESEVGDE